MNRREIAISLCQLAGLGLLLSGSFALSIPAGIAVTGLALLALGWALDRG